MSIMRSGRCLCGRFSLKIRGEPREVSACHCRQCRKTSSGITVSAEFPAEAVTISGADSARWFRSSDAAQRAFCSHCGSRLFWKGDGDDAWLWISVGLMDGPTGWQIQRHAFVADKPDWYEIDDGKPQFAAYADHPPDHFKERT